MLNMTPLRNGRTLKPAPNSARIVEVFKLATDAEMQEGMRWYEDAHAVAVRLDPHFPRRAAGVLAAISPRLDWGRNIALAAAAYEAHDAGELSEHSWGCMHGNARKAERIMLGEDPDAVLGGDKVRAFFETIDDPSGDGVVIDRHAFDVAMGRVTNDETRAALSRKGVYQAFASRYVRAAAQLSIELGEHISASQVQAVTWTVWRRLKGLSA